MQQSVIMLSPAVKCTLCSKDVGLNSSLPQRLKHSTRPALSSDVPPSQCVPDDDTIFTQRPWTDMLSDLDLNSEIHFLYLF